MAVDAVLAGAPGVGSVKYRGVADVVAMPLACAIACGTVACYGGSELRAAGVGASEEQCEWSHEVARRCMPGFREVLDLRGFRFGPEADDVLFRDDSAVCTVVGELLWVTPELDGRVGGTHDWARLGACAPEEFRALGGLLAHFVAQVLPHVPADERVCLVGGLRAAVRALVLAQYELLSRGMKCTWPRFVVAFWMGCEGSGAALVQLAAVWGLWVRRVGGGGGGCAVGGRAPGSG